LPKHSKAKKNKTKRGKSFPIIALIAFLLMGFLVYYLSKDSLFEKEEEIIIRPIEKTQTEQKENVPESELLYDEADYHDAEADSIALEPKTEDRDYVVVTPKPSITEKGKLYTINSELPKICIIVDDFGYIKGKLLDSFLNLDKEIAFSIIPGLAHSVETMNLAVQNGHEALIHMPMEPLSYPKDDPGSNAIFVKMSDEEIEVQMKKYFDELNKAVGINHHMGSKAAADRRVMETVLRKTKEKSLFYIDSFTDSHSVIEELAESMGIRFAKRRQFLDVPESSKKRAILKVDEIKKMKGNVIVVITHCHNDMKYRQLKFFIERLKDNHYQIIPPSKAVRIY
jgi:polysaccharide deacetylase 2 family uncharacterized protein YibQ